MLKDEFDADLPLGLVLYTDNISVSLLGSELRKEIYDHQTLHALDVFTYNVGVHSTDDCGHLV